jgi:hypothetical protein
MVSSSSRVRNAAASLPVRPDPEFVLSLRSSWDGKDGAALSARIAAYGEAGVDHVLVEPAERMLDDWLRAVERVGRAGERRLRKPFTAKDAKDTRSAQRLRVTFAAFTPPLRTWWKKNETCHHN